MSSRRRSSSWSARAKHLRIRSPGCTAWCATARSTLPRWPGDGSIANLRPPDRTAFEEAHASFGIRGQRVHFNRLDLYGNVISLSGQGEMNVDGSDLQLDFYAVWARLVQVLPPILRDIPSAIGQSVLKIKMRGRIGDPRFTKEPVPVLVEPVERLLKRMKGQQNPAANKGEATPVPGSAPN